MSNGMTASLKSTGRQKQPVHQGTDLFRFRKYYFPAGALSFCHNPGLPQFLQQSAPHCHDASHIEESPVGIRSPARLEPGDHTLSVL